MRRQKSDDDEDGGLDSLLDTMTNVVGILVLVLIVTQLGVSDAIQQITENSDVTADDVEDAKEQLADVESEAELLRVQTSSMDSFDFDAAREELRRMKELLENRKKLLAEQKEEQNEFAISLEQDRKQAAENQKVIAETKKNRDELQQKITSTLDRRDELKALLDKTPQPSGPPPETVITVPNPRPAPEGAKQATFVCQGNLVYPMNLEEIRKDAELKAKAIIVRLKLNLDPAKGIDPDKFEAAYTKLKYPTDPFFQVEYYVSGKRYPRIRLIPKEEKGASEQELTNRNSRFRRLLALLDPEKYYARFYVLPDSFDAYLTARAVMSESNLLAGWVPQNEGWVFTSGIGGGIELGPPRPKPPTPTTKPKPTNVID